MVYSLHRILSRKREKKLWVRISVGKRLPRLSATPSQRGK
jgi:hypothetical protein